MAILYNIVGDLHKFEKQNSGCSFPPSSSRVAAPVKMTGTLSDSSFQRFDHTFAFSKVPDRFQAVS